VGAVATFASSPALAIPVAVNGHHGWEIDLEGEAVEMLAAGQVDVWDALAKRFESRLIQAALANTKGRRIEAAQKLGIGRNTITRKIQELGLE
jgi:two-component system nitrogen regulation response regulator GlnG